MSSRTVLLLGATGLVGGHALAELAHDDAWSRVVTLGRRPMDRASSRHEHHVVDFNHLENHRERFACDDLAICLGTTIKKAGSQAAFRRVDLELPMEAAELAYDRGARHLAIVSALGADPHSRIFYNRTKGEAEHALQSVGYGGVHILRPSILDGERDESRPAERIGLAVLGALAPVMVGPLRPYRPTPARDVALALVHALRQRETGTHVLEPEAIREAAEQREASAL